MKTMRTIGFVCITTPMMRTSVGQFSSLVLLSYNLPSSFWIFENFQRTCCNRSYERTSKELMDQGKFFDQFFGIVFGTVVVMSQDWGFF
jgi:hypothetical protein